MPFVFVNNSLGKFSGFKGLIHGRIFMAKGLTLLIFNFYFIFITIFSTYLYANGSNFTDVANIDNE